MTQSQHGVESSRVENMTPTSSQSSPNQSPAHQTSPGGWKEWVRKVEGGLPVTDEERRMYGNTHPINPWYPKPLPKWDPEEASRERAERRKKAGIQ
ncbi:MAG: hypothetical protein KF812_10250 [Fimbriimonadaceae bacterium]|nr:hypothetical protein [Fimbriimonadaceae bacterium]